MESYEEYKREHKLLSGMIEVFEEKPTKAQAKRIRKQMDVVGKLKVAAKKDLMSV